MNMATYWLCWVCRALDCKSHSLICIMKSMLVTRPVYCYMLVKWWS